MSTKTRYREPRELAEKIAETIPPSEKISLDSEPADAVVVHHETDKPPNEAVDEATARLQHQLAALKQSEELQRQHAAQMMPQPPTREQMLNQVSPEWRRFLEANPRLLNNFQLAANAAAQALQEGHALGSEAQMGRTRELVDQHLAHLQAQDTAPAAAQPASEFFRSPPTLLPAEPSRASIVSAPVSRGEVGGYREPSPSSMRLTVEQKEVAAASGISEVQYAKNLLRLRKEIDSGDRQR
jgi:preprotein translocase subunit SecA